MCVAETLSINNWAVLSTEHAQTNTQSVVLSHGSGGAGEDLAEMLRTTQCSSTDTRWCVAKTTLMVASSQTPLLMLPALMSPPHISLSPASRELDLLGLHMITSNHDYSSKCNAGLIALTNNQPCHWMTVDQNNNHFELI